MNKHYDEDTIGPVLTRLRANCGYSQEELAQLLCARSGHPTIDRHVISRWERQERIPGYFWLTWLAQVLNVPIDVLREASIAARHPEYLGASGADANSRTVSSWLTLHHGPTEIVIALGGVEVDKILTVLAPVTDTADNDKILTTVEANQ